MPRKRYNVNLDPELHDRVVGVLGDTSFSRFTERALEAALTDGGRPATESGSVAPAAVPPSSASPRAPLPRNEDGTVPVKVTANSIEPVDRPLRSCERCGAPIGSPTLRSHPGCGGRVVPVPA